VLPDVASWREASAYDYWDDLAPEGLAWEFLRRNPDYQLAFAEGTADAAEWGLRALHNPTMSAEHTSVHWRPGFNTAEILLASPPLPEHSQNPTNLPVPFPGPNCDTHGLFGTVRGDGADLHVSYLGERMANSPVCVVLPLDAHIGERIEALQRLRRLMAGQAAPDTRLTPEKRRRLRQIARAHDGRSTGASHRDIASALFGRKRTQAEHWKTSSLRYATLRLLQDGRELVFGGYSELLGATRLSRSHTAANPATF
jgi:hypothetical protein